MIGLLGLPLLDGVLVPRFREDFLHAETAFYRLSFLDEVAAEQPEPPSDGRFIGVSFEWLE